VVAMQFQSPRPCNQLHKLFLLSFKWCSFVSCPDSEFLSDQLIHPKLLNYYCLFHTQSLGPTHPQHKSNPRDQGKELRPLYK
jgi:hypothetical protein